MTEAAGLLDDPSLYALAPNHDGARVAAVEVVSSLAGLDGLSAEWTRLEQLSGPITVFQSFSHVRIWARHFLAGANGGHRLHVAVVREQGRAVLILPLVISGRAPLKIARIAGDPIAQFADLLLDPDADAQAAFDAALASVAERGVDAITLRRVREDSNLLALAGGRLRPGAEAAAAPFADLSPFPDFTAYLQSLSKNMRKGLRNRKHHLGGLGDVSFEMFHGGPQARAALADAIDLKRTWLVQRGAISSAFLDPSTKACLLELAESGKASGALVMRLSVDGEPAAIRFGFEYQGTHFAYLSAYDQKHASLAPGKMLMEFCMSGFRERGLDRLDMLAPVGRHKTDWCTRQTAVQDYTLQLTLAGRVYGGLYQERLRPGMRTAWQHMPNWMRSALAAVFVTI